jgi:hypothetical protein
MKGVKSGGAIPREMGISGIHPVSAPFRTGTPQRGIPCRRIFCPKHHLEKMKIRAQHAWHRPRFRG